MIGPDYPTYFIAEIGGNFDGSLDKAKRLIDAAKEAGAEDVGRGMAAAGRAGRLRADGLRGVPLLRRGGEGQERTRADGDVPVFQPRLHAGFPVAESGMPAGRAEAGLRADRGRSAPDALRQPLSRRGGSIRR